MNTPEHDIDGSVSVIDSDQPPSSNLPLDSSSSEFCTCEPAAWHEGVVDNLVNLPGDTLSKLAAIPALSLYALNTIGFTPQGVSRGSLASSAQRYMGDVRAGSMFSRFTSLGMRGERGATAAEKALITAAVGGAMAGAVWAGGKAREWWHGRSGVCARCGKKIRTE